MANSNNKTKYNFLKYLAIFCFVIALGIFAPKFFLNNSKFATSFNNSVTGGDWNNHSTWSFHGGLVQLSGARGIAISSTGEIYIADEFNNRILVLNPNGTASTTYPAGSLPTDVFLAPSGEIYVSNLFGPTAILILNPDGTASTTHNVAGTNQFGGIAISQTGEIYITSSNRVTVLTSSGVASTTYGPLSFPFGLAIATSTGRIYLAIGNGTTIQVLNPGGSTFASYNGGIFAPMHPRDVAISKITGRIYAPTYEGHIVVLNPDGTAFAQYDNLDASYSPSALGDDYGIALGRNDEIYISDGSRIVVLNPDGTASTTFNGLDFPPGHVDVEGFDYPGINDDVTLNSGTVTLTQDQNIHSVTLASGGTLNLNGHILNVSGDWTNTGGTLTSGGGTINLIGSTTQSIFGENTFENLIKIATTSSSLLFDPSGTTTITNNLSFSGSLGNLLSIAPAGQLPPQFLNIFGSGELGQSMGIALDLAGNMYIADNDNHRIVELSPTGDFIMTLGKGVNATTGGNICTAISGDTCQAGVYDTNPEGIGNIIEIAVDASGNIYEADQGNDDVQVFSSTGAFVMLFGQSVNSTTGGDLCTAASGDTCVQFGTYDTGAGHFYPYGLALDALGNIYIADNPNNRIQKFNSNGVFVSMFGKGVNATTGGNICTAISGDTCHDGAYTSIGDGIVAPTALAIDSSGNIYAADSNNNTIVKFGPTGDLILTFGKNVNSTTGGNICTAASGDTCQPAVNGFGPGELDGTVYGLAVDAFGNIYATDSNNNRTQIFNQSGSYVSQFGSSGTGQLNGPFGITFDVSGNIYIVSQYDSQVVKFSAPSSVPFNIVSLGTASTSYLSVSGSTNQSSFAFSCLIGCLDGGNNINWIFPAAPEHAASTAVGAVSIFINPVRPSVTPTSTPITNIQNTLEQPESSVSKFTRTLSLGSIGEDVRQLQVFLNSKGYIVSNTGYGARGLETAYFGPKTYKALIRFQEDNKKDILLPQGLAQATGVFWNYTRQLINFILGK